MVQVIHGKDGVLFLAGDNNAVIEQHTGRILLNWKARSDWRGVIRQRSKRLARDNIHFYVQIVPDKHSVYREYLPEEYRYTGKKNVDLVQKIARRYLGHRVSFPLEQLKAPPADRQTYHKADTHWTDYGAYIGYLNLLQSVRRDLPEIPVLDDPVFEMKPYRGDLGVLLELEEQLETPFFVKPDYIRTVFENSIRVTGKIQILENPYLDNMKTIMIFGGSSTTNFVPYLSQSFRQVLFCWSANFDWKMIEYYKPDIVVFQIRERFLIRAPDDEAGFTTSEIAFAKRYTRNPGERFIPIDYNADTLILDCLSKIGYPINTAYLKAMEELCIACKIPDVYRYSMAINREKTRFKKVRKLVRARLESSRPVPGDE